jgi:hypothetical protein
MSFKVAFASVIAGAVAVWLVSALFWSHGVTFLSTVGGDVHQPQTCPSGQVWNVNHGCMPRVPGRLVSLRP